MTILQEWLGLKFVSDKAWFKTCCHIVIINPNRLDEVCCREITEVQMQWPKIQARVSSLFNLFNQCHSAAAANLMTQRLAGHRYIVWFNIVHSAFNQLRSSTFQPTSLPVDLINYHIRHRYQTCLINSISYGRLVVGVRATAVGRGAERNTVLAGDPKSLVYYVMID